MTKGSILANGEMQYSPGLLQSTPTFLVVTGDGLIIGEESGWSNDELWLKAFDARIVEELRLAAKSRAVPLQSRRKNA